MMKHYSQKRYNWASALIQYRASRYCGAPRWGN